ncbi:MAG: hypothetical protein MN733_35340 [Nitrososphaera sp.]|nr:hypothetical protein [Nitrososphaera sp.]
MKDRLPEVARRGVVIETADPYPEVRKNAETAPDWPYREEAQYLYRIASILKDRFLDPVLLTDRRRLPDPVISFESLRNRKILAAYTLARNPQGLLYELTFNTQHYVDREVDGQKKKVWEYGRWAQLETLLHEQIHLWQQNFGEDPVKPGKAYHNREFVDKCESYGLHPKLGEGYHLKLADGLFADLMKEMGIEPPADVPRADGRKTDWFKWILKDKERKGKSTLTKYSCPQCGLNVRVGIKDDPLLLHMPCGSVLVRDDGKTHNVYETPNE